MVDIIIQGIHGRMGHALCEMIDARTDCRVVAGIDPRQLPCSVPVFSSILQNTVPANVLIDFSNPSAMQDTIAYCAQHKLPCVICTTGLSDEQQKDLEQLSHTVPVFKSANMSLGINLLIELVQRANAVLGTAFDIEIIEKHHHNKLDAPSGTAMMIADALRDAADVPYHYVYDRHGERRKREPTEIGIHAVRGGSIVGEHEVLFAGPDETITISHSAASRNVFASGALNAAVFLADKPAGMYNMKDMLKGSC